MSDIEWRNGDKCSYEADNDSHTFIGMTESDKCCIRYDAANNFFEVEVGEISKPETPEQKAERERIEAAYDLYLARCKASKWKEVYTFDEFISEKSALIGWMAVVDLTGYRKQ